MRWFWGTILIFIGIVFLGANFGWWSAHDFVWVWQFWPILLIFLGISILLRHWRFGWAIMLLLLILLLSFSVYSVATHKTITIKGVSVGKVSTSSISVGLPSNISSADVNVDIGGANLTISDRSDKLIEGDIRSNIFQPEITSNMNNEKATVTIKTSGRADLFRSQNLVNEINLKLTDKIPLNLNLNAGASNLNLDLSKYTLSGLSIDSGASKIQLKVGESMQDGSKVNISAGASKIEIKVPNSLGVKISFDAPLSSQNFSGFGEVDSKTFKSNNYDSAPIRVEFNIDAGVSSISASRY